MITAKPVSNTKRWRAVLESKIGRPLRNRTEASILATLLNTQNRLNRGALNEATNVSADVAQYQQYALPLIRRQFPELLAMNTVAVIPTVTPQGIYFALRFLYENEPAKTAAFRRGQKPEIGYDLIADHTGVHGYFNPWLTSEGEMLSNYMEGTTNTGTAIGTDPVGILQNHFNSNNDGTDTQSAYAFNIKKASVRVISGAIRVGTRAIKSQYTLELQQDMAAAHGQDVEALLLEGLQFELQQDIDREILQAMVLVAQTDALGGEKPFTVDLTNTDAGVAKGRWSGESIASGVVNTIIAVSRRISITTRMGSGNFAICSPSVCAAIATLNNGVYIASPYMGANVETQPEGGVSDAGVLVQGGIKLYQDIYSFADYALVGFKGARQGESGIIMMPYIPYIFTKTAGQEDGSPRLIVKSRYAIVANLLGAGQFYRLVTFKGISNVIAGISFDTDHPAPFNSNGSIGVTADSAGLATATYDVNGAGTYDQIPGGLTFSGSNW